jgi:DNA-binding response OmpR family regulator
VTAQPLILVAEDDTDIRELVGFSLRREGWRTTEASNGVEALRRVGTESPDLVVLDIGMPGLDGHAVCRILRAKGDGAPPVIFLTARSQPTDLAAGLDLGAVDYVGKPFAVEELVARVRTALRMKQKLETVGEQAIENERRRVRAALRAAARD